mgnify:CR=1 FL=1
MRFLVAGGARGALAEAHLVRFEAVVEATGREPILWESRRGRRLVGAAMILPSAGRVGMLVAAPVDAPGVEPDAVAPAVSGAARHAIRSGMAYVQALNDVDAGPQVRVLEQAGLRRLAELVCLDRGPGPVCEPTTASNIRWASAEAVSEQVLGRLIARTYEGTLDCPAVTGLRTMEQVLAGLRDSGTYRPDWWLIAETDRGEPIGCALVNDGRDDGAAEIVYLGVVPEHRGRGLGKALVTRAVTAPLGAGRDTIQVIADAANGPAMSVYEGTGFTESRRRLAHFLF